MLLENNLKKYKESSEEFKQIVGLVGLTIIIILIFMILNIFFGVSDKSAKDSKAGDKNETVVASLPKGRLNFFEGNEGHKLSQSEYEAAVSYTHLTLPTNREV